MRFRGSAEEFQVSGIDILSDVEGGKLLSASTIKVRSDIEAAADSFEAAERRQRRQRPPVVGDARPTVDSNIDSTGTTKRIAQLLVIGCSLTLKIEVHAVAVALRVF